jgi:hypothetical protein
VLDLDAVLVASKFVVVLGLSATSGVAMEAVGS